MSEQSMFTPLPGGKTDLTDEPRSKTKGLYQHPTTLLEFESIYREEYKTELETCDKWVKWGGDNDDKYCVNFHQGRRSAFVFNNIKMEQLLRVLKHETPNVDEQTEQMLATIAKLTGDFESVRKERDKTKLQAMDIVVQVTKERDDAQGVLVQSQLDILHARQERDEARGELDKKRASGQEVADYLTAINRSFLEGRIEIDVSDLRKEFQNAIAQLDKVTGGKA